MILENIKLLSNTLFVVKLHLFFENSSLLFQLLGFIFFIKNDTEPPLSGNIQKSLLHIIHTMGRKFVSLVILVGRLSNELTHQLDIIYSYIVIGSTWIKKTLEASFISNIFFATTAKRPFNSTKAHFHLVFSP